MAVPGGIVTTEPSDNGANSPPPWQRQPSPVARMLLWALSLTIIGSALAGAWLTSRRPADPLAPLGLELRTHNAMWRVGQRMPAAEPARDARKPRAAVPAESPIEALRRESLDLLFTRASAFVPAERATRGQAAIVAHCLATEQYAQAAAFAARAKPQWGADLATALVGLPAEHTRALGERARGLPAVEAARAAADKSTFGADWSPWTRDRVRLQIALRAMAAPVALPTDATSARDDLRLAARAAVRKLNGELQAADRSVAAALFTALHVVGFAALFGLGMLVASLVRALLARQRGQPAWQWLGDRYPGLPDDNPYGRDLLTPFLGLAVWMGGQGAAGIAIAVVVGKSQSGFAMLLSGMVGVVAAQMAVTLLSPTRLPVLHAARLGGDPTAPFWRASTAALRAWAVLVPLVALASAANALLLGDPDSVHPIQEIAARHPDPVTLAALGAAAIILAPIAEELVFRGLVLRYFRQRFGLWPAVVVSSLLFAGMHLSIDQMLPLTVLGVGFALVYVWVGNLWASVVLHALWNTGSFVLTVGLALS